jgi:group I intron endonuclease
MVNYQFGKVYKVVNDVNDTIYVGSTAQQRLSLRMRDHRHNSMTRSSKFYSAMNEIGAHHFSIILICTYPCATKDELESKEHEIIKALQKAGQCMYNSMIEKHKHSVESIAKRLHTFQVKHETKMRIKLYRPKLKCPPVQSSCVSGATPSLVVVT